MTTATSPTPSSPGFGNFMLSITVVPLVVALPILVLEFALLGVIYDAPVARVWTTFAGDGSISARVQRVLDPTWRARWGWQIWTCVGVAAGLGIWAGAWAVIADHRPPKPKSRKAQDLRTGPAKTEILRRGCKAGVGLFAGRFGGKPLYVPDQDRGLVIGPPRTGKTSFLINQILRLSARRASFISVDSKPEIRKLIADDLKAAGYRVVSINPVGASPDAYNMLDDIPDEVGLAELAVSLLPVRDTGDVPFTEAQRDFLKAVLYHLKQTSPAASLPAAYALLSQFPAIEQFLAVMAASPSPSAAAIGRRLQAGLAADPLVRNGYSGVGRRLDWLVPASVSACLTHSSFRIADLGQESRPIALFFEFPESRMESLAPLLAAFYGHFLRGLIDTHEHRGPVALFLDEIGTIPPIHSLLQRLNTIAGRKLPSWTYWQSTAQMQRYGQGAEQTFFGAADLQMVFRSSDAGTQKAFSDLVGTTEAEQSSVSHSRLGYSHSNSVQRIAMIEPHEIGELADGEVIVLYKGGKAIGRATPYFEDFRKYRRKT